MGIKKEVRAIRRAYQDGASQTILLRWAPLELYRGRPSLHVRPRQLWALVRAGLVRTVMVEGRRALLRADLPLVVRLVGR